MLLRVALLLTVALGTDARAEGFRSFDGHGGPVKGVALSADGAQLLTASFDYAVGYWNAKSEADPVWLEGHTAAVNTVAFLPGNRAVSAGDDFTAILWDLGNGQMLRRFEGHQGKIMSARPSPDGTRLATASWDGTARIWDIATGETIAVLGEHRGSVNDVAWARGGAILYTAGYDGAVIEWDAESVAPLRRIAEHGFGVNVLALDEDAGWLAYGGLDGGTHVIDIVTGAEQVDLTGDRRPILALARAPDGGRLAVGDGEGHIMVVETGNWRVEHDFRAAVNGPIWALAFTAEGGGVIAGGIADEAYLWPLDAEDSLPRMAEMQREFHTDPAQVPNGERQFLRKCSICHTLGPDGERRAGPSLYGVFGRRAGTLAGYNYSPALTVVDLIWTDETIDRLFEIGPDYYTPGSKMPMQKIASPQDRADLIAFLKRETSPD